MFFKQIILFYNNFDNTKLKRFGRLGRKGQFGGINFFFLLLESRIDSIVLRLNLGSKFLMRELIRSKKVLIENVAISYLNFIVKKIKR
jgi:ribosomal protein S4